MEYPEYQLDQVVEAIKCPITRNTLFSYLADRIYTDIEALQLFLLLFGRHLGFKFTIGMEDEK